MDYNSIPTSLKNDAQWCVWKFEELNGRKTKIPYNAVTLNRARANDMTSFNNFAVVKESYERGSYDGMGIGVFSPFAAIDIDHCIEDGQLSDMANEIVNKMGSYTEISPSGTGLRIIILVPNGFNYNTSRFYINNRNIGLEIYVPNATKRFVTITGNRFNDAVVVEASSNLLEVCEQYMLRPNHNEKVVSGEISIINAQERENDKYTLLMDGKWEEAGYKSQSEADMALCALLVKLTCGNINEIDKTFRQSKLYRDKWDEKHGVSTYGMNTISNALATSYCMPIDGGDYSDASNSVAFSKFSYGSLYYCKSLGWLGWDGKRWVESDSAATAMGMDFSEFLLEVATNYYKKEQQNITEAKLDTITENGAELFDGNNRFDTAGKIAEKALNHAKRTRSRASINNFIELSKPSLEIMAKELDANPHILNTEAGIVDLRNGNISEHDSTVKCTKLAPFSPSEEGIVLWENFLEKITEGDKEMQQYLQNVAGMCSIGKVYHEGVILAVGAGRNGKSTFFNTIAKVFGDYAGSIDVRTLTTERQNKGASLATLRGCRFVTCGELEENQRLSVSTLKKLASTDNMVIEVKFKQPETVEPTHHICMFSNFLPRVGSTDEGTWRRIHVVPFKATMPTGENDITNYTDVLVEKAGGAILKWIIEGAVRFYGNGCRLTHPQSVMIETKEYRERENWFKSFISECCILDDSVSVRAGELYNEYKKFANETGDYCRRSNVFTEAMRAEGFKGIAPQNKKSWLGIKIDPERIQEQPF